MYACSFNRNVLKRSGSKLALQTARRGFDSRQPRSPIFLAESFMANKGIFARLNKKQGAFHKRTYHVST